MMIVRFNSYVQVNNSFWIREGDFFVECKGNGVIIEGFKEFDFFIHKVAKGRLEFWAISDAISGTRIGKLNKSLKKTKNDAERLLRMFNSNRVQYRISESVANKFISPRYRFVANPNNVIYVATENNNNKKFIFPRVYGIQLLEE